MGTSGFIPTGTPEFIAEQAEALRKNDIASRIHYPGCWDTAAYPTLQSAVDEIGDESFECCECGPVYIADPCDKACQYSTDVGALGACPGGSCYYKKCAR